MQKFDQCSETLQVETLCLVWHSLQSLSHNYRNVGTAESESILSKTHNYLLEKRKRSQSQPPVEKKEKRKNFDFLSTSNFSQIQVPRKSCNPVSSSKKDPSDSWKITANQKENQQRKTKPKITKEAEKQTLIKPQFCNIQKFEFSLKNHRQFVQTLVWMFNSVHLLQKKSPDRKWISYQIKAAVSSFKQDPNVLKLQMKGFSRF